MKAIRIVPKVKTGAVELYVQSKAEKIRVYREQIEEAKFTICDTEREPAAAQLVYEGTPERPSAQWYLLKDLSVQVNGLYYYWVEEVCGEQASVCHPVLGRVRNTDIWWPREKYRMFMHTVAKDFPAMAEVIPCGRTVRNYPLEYLWVGNRQNTVMYIGAVHPGESGPEIFLTAVRSILENQPELLEKTGVAILPAVSADLREDEVEGCPHYLRTNANAVDINRNFPSEWDIVSDAYGLYTDFFLDNVYRGSEPCSEPETQAVMKMFEQVKPRLAFSGHWLAGVCEDHLLTSSAAMKDTLFARKANAIRDVFCAGFDEVIGETLSPEERDVRYYCCGGSFPTWCYYNNVVAFDLEGGHRLRMAPAEKDQTTEELLELGIRCHTQAMKNILQYMAYDKKEEQ